MSRSARITVTLPKPVAEQLREVGTALRAARLNRNEPQSNFAARLNISLNTLRALERGDPRVGSGALVAAMWALGLPSFGDVLKRDTTRRHTFTKQRARKSAKALDDF